MATVEYLCLEGVLPDVHLPGVHGLHAAVFASPLSTAEFRDRLADKRGLLSVMAWRGAEIVGYKIGYARSREEFYSWLGGVAVHARRQGIASELMRRQHERVSELGYQRIVTETKNKWREMLILNLRSGFDIVGTYTDERGEPKIILAKTLARGGTAMRWLRGIEVTVERVPVVALLAGVADAIPQTAIAASA